MVTYEDLMTAIIKMQIKIIGWGVALRIASSVKGLEIDNTGKVMFYTDDPVILMKSLVEQYRKVEGNVALTLAKKAIEPLLKDSKLKIPKELK